MSGWWKMTNPPPRTIDLFVGPERTPFCSAGSCFLGALGRRCAMRHDVSGRAKSPRSTVDHRGAAGWVSHHRLPFVQPTHAAERRQNMLCVRSSRTEAIRRLGNASRVRGGGGGSGDIPRCIVCIQGTFQSLPAHTCVQAARHLGGRSGGTEQKKVIERGTGTRRWTKLVDQVAK